MMVLRLDVSLIFKLRLVVTHLSSPYKIFDWWKIKLLVSIMSSGCLGIQKKKKKKRRSPVFYLSLTTFFSHEASVMYDLLWARKQKLTYNLLCLEVQIGHRRWLMLFLLWHKSKRERKGKERREKDSWTFILRERMCKVESTIRT